MAPIDCLTMNIGGDYSTSTHRGVANFTDGQGTISYSATQSLLAYTNMPAFTQTYSQTEETGNVIYGALPANRALDVSQLWGQTPQVPLDLADVLKHLPKGTS